MLPAPGIPPLLRFTLPLLLLWARPLPAADPWQAALNLDYTTAATEFEGRLAADPDNLRLTNARAASLLVQQPRTAANLETARGLFESVLARATAGDREQRALALYLLARLDHEHVAPPRLEAARSRYEQLRREHSGHPLADQAAVHLALLLAFQTPGATPEQAVAAVTALLAECTSPAARRELHHLLAHIHWRVLRDAAAALPHYLAGRAIGFETPYRNSELDLTIAGLAAGLGRHELASRHYLAFVEANPRDARAPTARRLAARP